MVENHPPSPWWSPGRHADKRPFLTARGAVTRAVRAWFETRGFAEVETGVLQISPGNETHLHAPRAELFDGDGRGLRRYLRTSPEFACKKLLAAGERRIFEFARVFRDRERGDLHLPEFTMLEWYRAGADYEVVMADTIAVVVEAAEATGIRQFSFRGRTADPFADPERLTVAVPSHCPLLDEQARTLACACGQVARRRPRITYISGSTARALFDGDRVMADLAANMARPVLWADTLRHAWERGARAALEMPSGSVLTRLAQEADFGAGVALCADGNRLDTLVQVAHDAQ